MNEPVSSSSESQIIEQIQRYAGQRGYALDAAQLQALPHFQRLYEDLLALQRLDMPLIRLMAKRKIVKGIYLWGGVGRGKSFLMDTFFACVPLQKKQRLHFHRFMQQLHTDLRALNKQANPVAIVAQRIARQARLLCLDEMQVTDIGDAMLMRRLLESLFGQGVVLVTTSNQHPDRLYEFGLQRSQFVPAITLLKQSLEVINVDVGHDYRLRTLEQAGIYYTPLGEAAEEKLAAMFHALAGAEGATGTLEIEGRKVSAKRLSPGAAWFDFVALCDSPRAQADYIELARHYHTIFLSGVPIFNATDTDKMRRFTWLVDEFYDRRVKLVMSAAAEIDKLFPPHNNSEIDRTQSRIVEMQTKKYLAEPHQG